MSGRGSGQGGGVPGDPGVSGGPGGPGVPGMPGVPTRCVARGVAYWRTFWYEVDEGGRRRRSKGFGRCDRVTPTQALAAYHRWLAAWCAAAELGRREHAMGQGPAGAMTVAELVEAHAEHAARHYRREGRPTGEAANFASAMKAVVQVFGDEPAEGLRARHLHELRAVWRARGMTATGVNQYGKRLQRVVRWGVSMDLLSEAPLMRLASVLPVRDAEAGYRRKARKRVPPVEEVERVMAGAVPVKRDLLGLMLESGMRPNEAVAIRPVDIHTGAEPWVYVPPWHKNTERNKQRWIYLGPRCRARLMPYMTRELHLPCFRPQEAVDQQEARRREAYRPPPDGWDYRQWDSYRRRLERRGHSRYGQAYTTASLNRAVEALCEAAGVEKFTVGALRHLAEARMEQALIAGGMRPEVARHMAGVYLGHARLETTAMYAQRAAIDGSALAEKTA